MQLAADEFAAWPESPDFHFALGDLLLDWAACTSRSAPTSCCRWPRQRGSGASKSANGRISKAPSLAAAVTLAAHNLAVLYDGTGRVEAARACRKLARHPSGEARSA